MIRITSSARLRSASYPTFKKIQAGNYASWEEKEGDFTERKGAASGTMKAHTIKIALGGQIWPALTISGPTTDQNGVCHIHSIMRLYTRAGRGRSLPSTSLCSASVDLGLAPAKQLKPPVIGAGSCLPHCPTSIVPHATGREASASQLQPAPK